MIYMLPAAYQIEEGYMSGLVERKKVKRVRNHSVHSQAFLGLSSMYSFRISVSQDWFCWVS